MTLTWVQYAWLARAGALPWLRRADDPDAPPIDHVPGFQELVGADDPGRLLRIAALLHAESDRMRKLSMQTLIVVGFLIGLASLVVLFAGYITSIDLQGASPVQKAQNYLSAAQSAEDTARQRLAERKTLLRQRMTYDRDKATLETKKAELEQSGLKGGEDWTDADRDVARLEQQFNNRPVDQRRTVDEYTEDIRVLEKALEDRGSDVVAMRKLLEQAQSMDVLNTQVVGTGQNETGAAPATATDTTEALIAAAVTRFGIVILIIFLAQALINLYRYSLRLSAFYRARAVMLVLANGDLTVMEQAGKSLSPDHLSLGREPTTPLAEVQKIAEVAKSLR